MQRQTWTDLSTFAAIAEAGTFTAAAAALGVTPSALSHAMRGMEERLGVRLLNRTTRSVALTQAGERLLTRLRPAMIDLDDTVRSLEAERSRPAGRIRISAHRTAATLAIAPKLPTFASRFPDVQVELAIEDGLVDIVARGFDAGARHEQVLENDMVSVRISEPSKIVYVAAPEYWRQWPTPKHPTELLGQRCIAYRMTSSGALFRWSFEKSGKTVALDPHALLISNDIDIIRGAAIGGVGVACLLEDQVRHELEDGTLVAVLKDWSRTVSANYLYYPGKRQMSAALRAFVETVRIGSDASGS